MSRVNQARKARTPSRKARPSLVLVTVYGLDGGRCTVRLDDRSAVAALIARLEEAERRRVDEPLTLTAEPAPNPNPNKEP